MKQLKDFSLKTKFGFGFVMDGILIASIALITFYFPIISGLGKIEDHYLESEFRSSQALINQRQELLLSTAKDYANWDDMYNFVDNPNERWAKLNIADWIPNNFGVDLILLFDSKAKLIYRYGDFEEFAIGKDLSSDPLVKAASSAKELKGLYPTSKGIIYIASSQVMHTDQSGPRNGTYLYGSLISKDRLQDLKVLTGLDVSILTKDKIVYSTLVGDIERPKNFLGIHEDLKSNASSQFNIYKPNYQLAFIYSVLKDVTGKDIGLIELISPRKSIALFREFFIKFTFWVYCLVILMVIVTAALTVGFLLKPLGNLKKAIIGIKETKDMQERIKVETKDEIGVLAKEFNFMMDELNKSREAIVKSEERLSKINECFLHFSTDAVENINRLTKLCGELMNATCALYNRLDGNMLCSLGKWNAPADYNPIDKPDGHICYDVIQQPEDKLFIVRDLPNTVYAQSDPNVLKYDLKTYVGYPIKCGGKHIGSLCVVYQQDMEFDKEQERIMMIIASAIEVEEERNIADQELKNAYDKLRQMQNQLIQSEKMATAAEFAIGTVHQINNPLSIAIGRLQLLRRVTSYKTKIPEADLEKDLRIIEEQTKRAVDITNNLLRYAKPFAFRFEKCNINELVREAIDLVRQQMQAENIQVKENLKTDLPLVQYCDTQQIKDVFINIIMNAQQAMPGGGKLEISTDYNEKEGMVYIKFTDNGCGISAENMKKLFTPFFSTKADKSGLGLPISYNIVKGHQGTIEVEGKEGVGSTFTVRLPVGAA